MKPLIMKQIIFQFFFSSNVAEVQTLMIGIGILIIVAVQRQYNSVESRGLVASERLDKFMIVISHVRYVTITHIFNVIW